MSQVTVLSNDTRQSLGSCRWKQEAGKLILGNIVFLDEARG